MKTFIAASSNGEFLVDAKTGKPLPRGYIHYDDLVTITKFDVNEYLNFYQLAEMPNQIDILDIGYFYKERKNDVAMELYEEPAHDWRKEVSELRKK